MTPTVSPDSKSIELINSSQLFRNCGRPLPLFRFSVKRIENKKCAIAMFSGDNWNDIKTEAQGDLTGYLSKVNYELYGKTWNSLSNTIKGMIRINNSLNKSFTQTWDCGFQDAVLVDLTRSILEKSYSIKYPKAPVFFSGILEIYLAGYLPCGWDGEIAEWPKGTIIVY